jgi:type VI secretion system secreted protein Hcp
MLAAMLGTTLAVAIPASAAGDQFIKFSDVKGDVLDKSHKGDVEILSWSWGVNTSGAKTAAAASAGGKPSVHLFTFTKQVDRASSQLLAFALNGKHLKTATLTMRKAGARQPLEFLRITFDDLVVTSVDLSGNGEQVLESVSIAFARVKYEYIPQSETGAAEAAMVTEWDVAANKSP